MWVNARLTGNVLHVRQVACAASPGARAATRKGREDFSCLPRPPGEARREALQLGHDYIGTEHILLGLIREGEGVAAQVLVKLGADLSRVRQQVIQLLHGHQGKEPAAAGAPSETAPSTSLVLDQFGRNLTAAAREGKLDPVIGREKEIERVMQVLSRRTKNNPVLLGEPAVGTTAVVEALAQRIVKGGAAQAPED